MPLSFSGRLHHVVLKSLPDLEVGSVWDVSCNGCPLRPDFPVELINEIIFFTSPFFSVYVWIKTERPPVPALIAITSRNPGSTLAP